MKTEFPFNVDLTAWRGCDLVVTIMMQDCYKQNLALEVPVIADWYSLVKTEGTVAVLRIYPAWSKTPMIEYKTIVGEFGVVTETVGGLPGNIPGLSGDFAVMRQEDSLGEDPDQYLAMHIPWNLTNTFAFAQADYELVLTKTDDETREFSSLLLAQGKVSVLGEPYNG